MKGKFAFVACLASAFVLASCGARAATPEEMSSYSAEQSKSAEAASASASASESASADSSSAASSDSSSAASSDSSSAASSSEASSEASSEQSSEASSEASSSEEITSPYTVEINGVPHVLEENTGADTSGDLAAEYMASNLTLTAGDVLVFKADGVALVPGDADQFGAEPGGEDEQTHIVYTNNVIETSGVFTVHNDAYGVGIYFKVWDSGWRNFWVDGYQGGGGGGDSSSSSSSSTGVGYYVRGTAVGGWDVQENYELVASGDSNNLGELLGVTLSVGEFKISNADWSKSWGWSYKNQDESQDHQVVQGGAKANFSKAAGNDGNISCDVAGTYNLYLTTNNYLYIETVA